MDSKISANSIWERVIKDPRYLKHYRMAHNLAKPYAEVLPQILGDMLELPVTLANIATARKKFIQYCLDHGFAEATVKAIPPMVFAFIDEQSLLGGTKQSLALLLNKYEPMARASDAYMRLYKVTERDLMVKKFGISGEALKLYDNHQLTIGALLEIQPWALIDDVITLFSKGGGDVG